jgi:hypothetical protein
MLLTITMSNFMPLEDFRSTKGLFLPPTWKQGGSSRGRVSIAHEFHLHNNNNISVVAFSRGFDLGDHVAVQVRNVLAIPPHVLDDFERQRITDVLAEQNVRNRFAISQVRTEELNGKTVLISEGTYASSGDRAITIFVDVLGNGHFVEEFQYAAPDKEFDQHLSTAWTIFRTIEWAKKK